MYGYSILYSLSDGLQGCIRGEFGMRPNALMGFHVQPPNYRGKLYVRNTDSILLKQNKKKKKA